ncbi:O-antigen ligase family protein [bacterium]|nr:O-antigen ligase family protein [bacterium]
MNNIILFFIILTLLSTLYCSTDAIGFLALIVIFLSAVKLFIQKDSIVKINSIDTALLIYFIFVVISLAGSTLFYLSLKGFLKTCTYLGFYLTIVHFLNSNRNKINTILLTIAGIVSFESIYAVFQNTIPTNTNLTWQDVSYLRPEEVMTRVYGTLQPYNPNLLAGFLIVCIPVVYGICAKFLVKKHYKSGIIALIFSVICSWAIICTGCRGAYLALLAILGGIILISAKFLWQNYKKIYIAVIGVICSISALAILSLQSIRMRFLSIFIMRQDSSNSFRFNVYQASWKMFTDNWLLGIGCGNQNFREIYGLYMKTGFDALSCYNIFLEIAVESGIFALLAFIAFLYIMLSKGIRFVLHSNNIYDVILMSAGLLSIIGVMVHGFVDTVFFRPQIQIIFWIMCAVLRVKLFEEN